MSTLTQRQLLDETLELIRAVAKYRLSPAQLMLFGAGPDTPAYAKRWDDLSRHVASAKLAIIRDEFASRFPSLAEHTEQFTFGIKDPIVDGYSKFLKPREPADLTILVSAMLDQLFPPLGLFRKRRLDGLATLGSWLTSTLTTFSKSVEKQFAPFAAEFGVPFS